MKRASSIFMGYALYCCTANATAMTVAGYQSEEAKVTDKGEPERSFAILGLMGFRSGIADTLNNFRADDGSFRANGVAICVPKGVAISDELVKSAIATAIAEQGAGGKPLSPRFLDFDVSMVATRGLIVLFPCAAR